MHPHHLPPILTLLLLATTITALNLTLPHNLTALIPPPNLTGHSIRNCVPNPSWNPPSLLITPDCTTALQALSHDGSTLPPHPGKFTYHNGHSSALFSSAAADDRTIRIPKRYVSGQCVVAIVMMKMFEQAGVKVPGLPMGVWPESEEVGWGELVEGAGYVRARCANGCGYATVGREDGVAVVVWEVDGWWDRFVRGVGGAGAGGGNVAEG